MHASLRGIDLKCIESAEILATSGLAVDQEVVIDRRVVLMESLGSLPRLKCIDLILEPNELPKLEAS